MEKKHRLLIILLTLFIPFHNLWGAKAPQVVETFINSLERYSLLAPEDINTAHQISIITRGCFSADKSSGINLRNHDLYLIKAVDRNGNPFESKITSQRYCNNCELLIFNKKHLKVKHKVLKTQSIFNPDLKDQPTDFDVTEVKKDLYYNGAKSTVWLRIEVCKTGIDKNKITKITTQNKSFTDEEVVTDKKISQMDSKELLKLAAEYYTRKDYTSAFETYQILTQKYESNAEGWYRMAIMTYKKKGCSFPDHKAAARKFMMMARDKASGEMLRKAEDVLYYWEHPNFM